MRPEKEHFSGNIKLNIIIISQLAMLVTHHSAIDKPPLEDYAQAPTCKTLSNLIYRFRKMNCIEGIRTVKRIAVAGALFSLGEDNDY